MRTASGTKILLKFQRDTTRVRSKTNPNTVGNSCGYVQQCHGSRIYDRVVLACSRPGGTPKMPQPEKRRDIEATQRNDMSTSSRPFFEFCLLLSITVRVFFSVISHGRKNAHAGVKCRSVASVVKRNRETSEDMLQDCCIGCEAPAESLPGVLLRIVRAVRGQTDGLQGR